MRKPILITLGVIFVVIATLGVIKFQQIQAAIAQGASFQPPPDAVTTVVVQTDEWTQSIQSIGSVAAVQGVTVTTDLPGIVRSIHFESGRAVAAGQVLVRLDARQEEAQLASAQARLDLSKVNLERARGLLERGVLSQSEYDRAETEYRQAEASSDEIRAVIDRKTIRAPFSGALGIRQVNLGQYLAAGDPVVSLQSRDPVYVNFSVPQQETHEMRVGEEVRVRADSISGTLTGRITAINSIVNESTRNLEVQATVHGAADRLRPGMFVDVEYDTGDPARVIPIPASAILYAPYGNSVFVLEKMKDPKSKKEYLGVSQRFVQVQGARGDQVAVVSGLEAGEQIATSGVFKLRPGAAVVVNNKIQPSNDPQAKPEDS